MLCFEASGLDLQARFDSVILLPVWQGAVMDGYTAPAHVNTVGVHLQTLFTRATKKTASQGLTCVEVYFAV